MNPPATLTADYVIVGSGAGGGPVALRLAEAGHSVIVIEAGAAEADDLAYSVPAFHAYASESPATSWSFFVHHYDDPEQERRDDKFVPAADGVLYPRAGTVGGCTAHHAMITVYPGDSDWDAVADLTGDDSWRASEMRHYFERLERCGYRGRPLPRPKSRRLDRLLRAVPLFGQRFAGNGHGFDGWLPTSIARPTLVLRDWQLAWVVARAVKNQLADTLGRRLHWRERLVGAFDPNDAVAQQSSMLGVWLIPISVDAGHRAGTRAPLHAAAAKDGGTLTLLPSTLATRLILDDEGRCTGVRCLPGAHLYRADPHSSPSAAGAEPAGQARAEEFDVIARREVVVSGGTFNSPQLLKLSGIGPADELAALGIDVRVDSPGVGAHLQDRYEVGVVNRYRKNFTLVSGGAFHPPVPGDPPDPYLAEWHRGKGPYTTNGAVLAVLLKSRPELEVPDLFLFALPANFRGYYPGYAADLERKPDHLTWAVLKAHTTNRAGTVTLRSTDPRDTPEIRFRYFGEGTDTAGADLDAMVAGVRFARGVAGRLESWGAEETQPGPGVDTDDEIRQWVQDNAWGHHACGTCAIGADGDPTAVLDSRFRVRGVPGLRVVDASVFPTIPGYFIVTSVYMAAEKAADAILADARTDARSSTETGWPGPPSVTVSTSPVAAQH